MPTRREAQELQALAQIALPAVRRQRPLSAALPCKADRYRLRAAAERVTGAAFWAGSSPHGQARLAAVEHLARGGDPWP